MKRWDSHLVCCIQRIKEPFYFTNGRAKCSFLLLWPFVMVWILKIHYFYFILCSVLVIIWNICVKIIELVTKDHAQRTFVAGSISYQFPNVTRMSMTQFVTHTLSPHTHRCTQVNMQKWWATTTTTGSLSMLRAQLRLNWRLFQLNNLFLYCHLIYFWTYLLAVLCKMHWKRI